VKRPKSASGLQFTTIDETKLDVSGNDVLVNVIAAYVEFVFGDC
jgi:hypothetical protein